PSNSKSVSVIVLLIIIKIIRGLEMPDGMKENDRFPEPLITPTTKATVGHDEDISREEILKQGLVEEDHYVQLENYTKALFQRGTEIAEKMGLILVDTKYEFGLYDGRIILIDEIHTPDSSRYFYAEGYQDRQDNDETQKQLSKEFVREWLMEHGFQGKDGQEIPEMTDEFVNSVSERYIELYESLSGESFIRSDVNEVMDRVQSNIEGFLKSHAVQS
ncbi:MAG TPA: phosphoribosylaminoimidazolesuccinocarboxamide synthase, partial [Flavobacteriales bacterium]|nr:phosphoribosylaminoimidazolesuccinocarboxamide synthase [Flavobacteriales bacterium]